jgi:ankyrin repeat domain-containing protein 50
MLQLRDHKIIQDDITEIKSLVQVVRATQISMTIRNWLKAPDATVNHEATCAKRHPALFFLQPFFFSGAFFSLALSFLWRFLFSGAFFSLVTTLL